MIALSIMSILQDKISSVFFRSLLSASCMPWKSLIEVTSEIDAIFNFFLFLVVGFGNKAQGTFPSLINLNFKWWRGLKREAVRISAEMFLRKTTQPVKIFAWYTLSII